MISVYILSESLRFVTKQTRMTASAATKHRAMTTKRIMPHVLVAKAPDFSFAPAETKSICYIMQAIHVMLAMVR